MIQHFSWQEKCSFLKTVELSHCTDSLKHSWAYQPHRSWVKINIFKTSAVSTIRVSVVRTNWSQPTTDLMKPYLQTEGTAGLVIWKAYSCNWNCTYYNRLLVLTENLQVVILKTCTTSGNIDFWREKNLVGWFLRLEPKWHLWRGGSHFGEASVTGGNSAMFHLSIVPWYVPYNWGKSCQGTAVANMYTGVCFTSPLLIWSANHQLGEVKLSWCSSSIILVPYSLTCSAVLQSLISFIHAVLLVPLGPFILPGWCKSLILGSKFEWIWMFNFKLAVIQLMAQEHFSFVCSQFCYYHTWVPLADKSQRKFHNCISFLWKRTSECVKRQRSGWQSLQKYPSTLYYNCYWLVTHTVFRLACTTCQINTKQHLILTL